MITIMMDRVKSAQGLTQGFAGRVFVNGAFRTLFESTPHELIARAQHEFPDGSGDPQWQEGFSNMAETVKVDQEPRLPLPVNSGRWCALCPWQESRGIHSNGDFGHAFVPIAGAQTEEAK